MIYSTDKILIENYEVSACHGVNPEEKVEPQRFIVSAQIFIDAQLAAQTDDVDQTVSYSAVCKRIKSFLCDNCFNLLERITVGLCELILKKFPIALRAEFTVKKPDAPMKGKFDWVGFSCGRSWHTAYLSLGSNLGDRNAHLDLAVSALKKDDNIRNVTESNRYETAPYGGVATKNFLNSAARIETLYSPEELLRVLNETEAAGGRKREARWDNRTLDIDIIFYDDCVIGTQSLAVPHPDIEHRLFVLEPLNELAPNYVHPITGKRVGQMLSEIKLI